MQKSQILSLGWAEPLGKEMATHSSILPEKSHGERSLVGYSPRVAKRVKHDWENTQQQHLLPSIFGMGFPRYIINIQEGTPPLSIYIWCSMRLALRAFLKWSCCQYLQDLVSQGPSENHCFCQTIFPDTLLFHGFDYPNPLENLW